MPGTPIGMGPHVPKPGLPFEAPKPVGPSKPNQAVFWTVLAGQVAGYLELFGTVSRSRTNVVAQPPICTVTRTRTVVTDVQFTGGASHVAGFTNGGLTKRYSIGAALSFIGSLSAVQSSRSPTFNASLSFSGSLTKQTDKSLTANLTFTGAQPKFIIKKLLAATLSFTSKINNFISTHLAGVLYFQANVSNGYVRATQLLLNVVGRNPGNVRLTQSVINVLGHKTGNARLTQMVILVIGKSANRRTQEVWFM